MGTQKQSRVDQLEKNRSIKEGCIKSYGRESAFIYIKHRYNKNY